VDLGAGGSVRLRAETTASLDPWQLLLLLAVPGDPLVRYVYLYWCVSGAPDCCFPMRGGIIFSRISLGVRRSFGVAESGETYPGCDLAIWLGVVQELAVVFGHGLWWWQRRRRGWGPASGTGFAV